MRLRQIAAALLALSAFNLCLMIPGGPIEARDFSAYPAIVLAGFNIFLTVLGLGSFILAWFMGFRTYSKGLLAGLAGLGYFVVYAIDLGGLFPVSPVAMPHNLFVLEWLGLVLSVPLIIVAVRLVMVAQGGESPEAQPAITLSRPLVIALGGLALAIVVFATYAAMSG
jgi:hypothetical protein